MRCDIPFTSKDWNVKIPFGVTSCDTSLVLPTGENSEDIVYVPAGTSYGGMLKIAKLFYTNTQYDYEFFINTTIVGICYNSDEECYKLAIVENLNEE